MMHIRAVDSFFRMFFAYFAYQDNFADRNNFVSYDKPYIFGIASSMHITVVSYFFLAYLPFYFDRIYEIL